MKGLSCNKSMLGHTIFDFIQFSICILYLIRQKPSKWRLQTCWFNPSKCRGLNKGKHCQQIGSARIVNRIDPIRNSLRTLIPYWATGRQLYIIWIEKNYWKKRCFIGNSQYPVVIFSSIQNKWPRHLWHIFLLYTNIIDLFIKTLIMWRGGPTYTDSWLKSHTPMLLVRHGHRLNTTL